LQAEGILRVFVLGILCIAMAAAYAQAQGTGSGMNDQPHSAHDMHDMQDMPDMTMSASAPDWKAPQHAGSGTGWEPASAPAHMWMTHRRGWDLMAHGVVFLDYNQQGGPRGAGKAESVNVFMLMEQRKLGKGLLLFRQMFSAESLTVAAPWIS
jgi:hypothetical protein